jgi:hypothetical protein
MARAIQAVTRYRPRLIASRTIGLDVLAESLSCSSIVSADLARLVLADLRRATVLALQFGQAVMLPGIGRIALELRTNGTIGPIMRFDPAFQRDVANLDEYVGAIVNRESIGLTAAEMVARWNEEHPDDPVMVAPRPDETR